MLAIWSALAVILLSRTCISSQCYLNFSRDKYPSCVQLSPNVSLHWVVQGGKITWAADIDGVWDWVGLGISEGGMLGADLAVAAHDVAAHQWKAADYWSTGFDMPQLDTQQDVSLVYISRQLHNNAYGSTLAALQRPLVTCDAADQDHAVLNDTRQTFVYAYGTGPFRYHGPNRGQAEVTFVPNATAAASGPTFPLQALELRMPTFAVPTMPTTYQCVNLALPVDAKYHIYSYEPLIDNAPLVHHFVAYTCHGDRPPSTPFGQPYDCLRDMECKDFYLGWAPGVSKVEAPPAAALAFGAGTAIKYIVLQIHYTNMEGLAGQNDSSGFRLSYSSTLKDYDMGVLTLGSYSIAVPPGAASWTTTPDVCPAGCTARLAGPAASAGSGGDGVTLVQSFYHMHMLGRSMVTRHVRNGVELPPLGSRDYFDFDYQAPVHIPPGARQLLPGDLLITSCTYSGKGRKNVTNFGLGSYEEMCFNFLMYYPYNANITDCVGVPGIGLASCASTDVIDQIFAPPPATTSGDPAAAIKVAVQAAVQAGFLVPVLANLTYRPYQPTCWRSVPGPGPTAGAAAAAAISDTDVDEVGSESPEQRRRREERNVGGAVAAILIVMAVGGVAIVVVVRAMKRRRQLEEEQHLFEKYNPNSIRLSIAVLGGTGMAAAGNSSFSAVLAGGGDADAAAADGDVYGRTLFGSGDGRGDSELVPSRGGGGAAV